GPALDLSNYDEHYKAVTQVLSSISGKYSQVVSPKTSRQNAWNYTSSGSSSYYDETPCMIAGGGYWIYLKEAASLAGLSYTPVEGPYSGPVYQDGVVRSLQEVSPSTSAIPEIPAAFAGKVVDPQGTVIDSATIQAVVDGVVRGEIQFSNGQFGLSPETLLIVQSLYDLNRKSISFLVNGHPAEETAVFSSGSLSSLTLTVDMVAPVPFTYQSVSVENNMSIKLNFNQNIVNNLSDLQALKKALSFSADGKEFSHLAEGDSISISGGSLTVEFSEPFTGSSNIIRLDSNSLKNTDGSVLSQAITSAAFSAGDQVIDECFIATAAFGSKFEPSVALLRAFRDRYLLTNSFGAAFVDFYYQNSPPIARYIANNGSLKFMVRILLVPAIAMAYLLFHPALLTALLAGLFLLAAYRRRRIIAG
ncbi:MAG: hypothetical protein PHX14_11895, partial [Syntrophomonadaceae bacterium]|nr:hypothetical protein [Syntrophomonadaceae bacterium]